MTRHGKCDFCRKLKIKCDELLPNCGGCVRRGRECTHTSLKKRPFRFVEVQGEILDDAKAGWSCPSQQEQRAPVVESKKRTVIRTRRKPECSAVELPASNGNDHLAAESIALLFKHPENEQSRIIRRWVYVMDKGSLGSHPLDAFGSWSAFVPRYLEHSELVAKAASCLAEAMIAHACKSEESYLVVSASYADAIISVRRALDDKSQRYDATVLLAVIVLYYTELVVSTQPNAFMYHAIGLANLFKKCYKTRDQSGDERDLVASVFHSVCFSSFPIAMFRQTDHALDNPKYYSIPGPGISLAELPKATAIETRGCLRRLCVLLPRLTRWVRQLKTGGAAEPDPDPDLAERAVELAISLYADNVDQTALQEALDTGAIRTVPTTHPLVLPATATSYAFAAPGVCSIFAPYWGFRTIVCSVLLTLHDAFAGEGLEAPPLLGLIDRRAVEEEDLRCAGHVSRCTQAALADDAHTLGREQIRVLMPLQMSFGTWHRAERRATAAEAWYEVERARSMKRWCLDRANDILRKWRRGDTAYLEMERGAEFWAAEKAFQSPI